MPKNYDSVYELTNKLKDYLNSLDSESLKKYYSVFCSDNEDDYSGYPKRHIEDAEIILYILMDKIGKAEIEKIVFDGIKKDVNRD